MPPVSELDALLDTEQQLGNRLIELIDEERRLLESRQFEDIPTLLDTKSDLLEQLDQAYQKRDVWCVANGFESAAGQTTPELAAATVDAMLRCAEIYKKIKYYNELNGVLIANSRKRARLQLEVMRGLANSDRVYDATGATTPTTIQRNLSSA